MNIDFFKNENELYKDGDEISKIKKQISYELLKNEGIKKTLKSKKDTYKKQILEESKNFLTNKLKFKFKPTDNKNISMFEFKKDNKIYEIKFSNQNNSMSISYQFNKFKGNMSVYINSNYRLNSLNCKLKTNPFYEGISPIYEDNKPIYEINFIKKEEKNSISWYKKQYTDIKELVNENVKIMDKLNKENIKDIFYIATNNVAKYNNISELITDIIENINN